MHVLPTVSELLNKSDTNKQTKSQFLLIFPLENFTKTIRVFLKKKEENGHQAKHGQTEKSNRTVGKRTRKEIGTGNRMRALKSQTGCTWASCRHPLASLQGPAWEVPQWEQTGAKEMFNTPLIDHQKPKTDLLQYFASCKRLPTLSEFKTQLDSCLVQLALSKIRPR